MNKVNLIFQKDYTEIGDIFEDIKNLVLYLGHKVFKSNFHSFELILNNIDNDLAYVDATQVDFGVDFRRAIQKVNISAQDLFNLQQRVKQYVQCLLKEIRKRLPEKITYFKNLQAFSPIFCLSQGAKLKFDDLPFVDIYIEEDKLSIIDNQYNSLNNVDWKRTYGEEVTTNSFKFWSTVYHHTNAGGLHIFKELAQFVFILLSLPSSNAVVERIFSIMNCVKTKIRNRMQLEMLNSILILKTKLFCENKCCENFQCSKEMFSKFNAKMYQNMSEEVNDVNEAYEIVDDEFNVPCLNVTECK